MIRTASTAARSLCVFLLFSMAGSGCDTFMVAAQKTKGIAAVALYDSAIAWEKYNAARLRKINEEEKFREDAKRRIDEYVAGEYSIAVRAFVTARDALATLDKLLAAGAAASSKQIGDAAAKAYEAVKQLLVLLKRYGVELPAGVVI